MATSDAPLSVPNVTLVVARGASNPPAAGNPLVRWDFANGDTQTTPSINQTGASMNDIKRISQAPSGKPGLEFLFQGTPKIYGDAGSEQRYTINQDFTDLYIKLSLYIPSNYALRAGGRLTVSDGTSVSGWQPGDTVEIDWSGSPRTAKVDDVLDASIAGEKYVYIRDLRGASAGIYQWVNRPVTNITRSNSATFYSYLALNGSSKFHALWGGSVGYTTSGGNAVIFGSEITDPDYVKDYSVEIANDYAGDQTNYLPLIDPDTDAGREIEYVLHVTRPTSDTSDDALMEMWKDGQLAHTTYNASSTTSYATADNTLGNGYILGYSNSGFDEDTMVYLHLFEIYGPNKPAGLTGGV